ncbi:MAG: hypothetical protein JSV74_05670 [Dehalococcoidia bacterium]|nr:MAG: hypothetical protein JSV74_05670 [Dehalococcoidia bacterium]
MKDTIKASIGVLIVIAVVIGGIEIYNALTINEAEEKHAFITAALTLYDDLDIDEVRDGFDNLLNIISNEQFDSPEGLNSLIDRELRLMRYYKESYYLLYGPTEEMYSIKKSLLEEGSLFLSSYYYLKVAVENKNNNKYDVYLLYMDKAIQYHENALNLRNQNGIELNQWKAKIDKELSN